MRFLVLLILSLLAVAAFAAKKADEWDELEDLLQNIDGIKDEDDEEDSLEKDKVKHGVTIKVADEDEDGKVKMPTENPCVDLKCGWGKECVLDKKLKPHCHCAEECPMPETSDDTDKVCSNQNETFPTLCHLYREKCLCKHNKDDCKKDKHTKLHLEYLGACKELETCSEDHMIQFPERMSDWLFQVMKEMKKRQELNGEDWLNLLDEAESDDEYKHVYPVLWKFCDLDNKPHDRFVTHQELIPITAPVIPMESCIKPFLHNCDSDNNNKITLKEWGKCLGLEDGAITDRC